MQISKRCFKCGETKPLFDFYKHPKMPDGHVNKCKTCNKLDVHKNRDDKLEFYREYDKTRYKEQGRRGSTSATVRRLNRGYPIKRKARNAVSNALRDGLLVKPSACSCCNNTENIEAHHTSYLPENWLTVVWLCSGCHGREHSRLIRENIEIKY